MPKTKETLKVEGPMSEERLELQACIELRNGAQAALKSIERAIDDLAGKGVAEVETAERALQIAESGRSEALISAALSGKMSNALDGITAARTALVEAQARRDEIHQTRDALRDAQANLKQRIAMHAGSVLFAIRGAISTDPAALALASEFKEVRVRYGNMLAAIEYLSSEIGALPMEAGAHHVDTDEYVRRWREAYRRLGDDPFTTLPSI